MNEFTFEEMNLLCIYNTGTRTGLIDALEDMKQYLETDETELLALTDSAIAKLRAMDDTSFEQLELYPDFDK
ncbi:MAG: transposon-transfer assisting family protein [Eubacteriales bacterium]|nr:transposon-transfer assisting family protein [Eubacteriales bacterium]